MPRQALYTSLLCDIVVERIPQHRHCIECGKAFVSSERYCSDECKEKHKTKMQGKKRQLLLLYFVSFITFAVIIVLWLWRF